MPKKLEIPTLMKAVETAVTKQRENISQAQIDTFAVEIPLLEPVEVRRDEREEDTGYNPYDHSEAKTSAVQLEPENTSDE